MKTLLPAILLLFTSCFGQSSTTLTFVNKSNWEIDSIVLFKPDRVVLKKIDVKQQYSKTLDYIQINTNREGAFPFTVYTKEKTLLGSWGFHDFGMLISKTEVFYIFDNGINTTGTPIEKPKELKLYFYNASNESINSFFAFRNTLKEVKELSPRSFEIIFDFDSIEKSNDFIVIINGKRKVCKIEHDFNNWNDNQTFLYYENNSIKKGNLPWRKPLEFRVDIENKLQFPSDSVKVKSNALVKTYYYKQPNYLSVVFDFDKLKQNPIFTIEVANKKYTIDLSSHDFSNIYLHQKIYFLDENGIKSLTK